MVVFLPRARWLHPPQEGAHKKHISRSCQGCGRVDLGSNISKPDRYYSADFGCSETIRSALPPPSSCSQRRPISRSNIPNSEVLRQDEDKPRVDITRKIRARSLDATFPLIIPRRISRDILSLLFLERRFAAQKVLIAKRTS